jgi:type II secretory pathway pseudopilin PulG
MRWKPTSCRLRRARSCAGFTLAEVLAALVFMAIVIPVAVEGLRVASLAGQWGVRRAAAARVAERVLNELVVTGQWRRGVQNGQALEGLQVYEWESRLDPWLESHLRVLTVRVRFPVQHQEAEVVLSTLVDVTQ